MKKILTILCLVSLIGLPTIASDLDELKVKRQAIINEIEKQQNILNQLQIALIQINAVIGYLDDKEKTDTKKGEKK